MLPKLTVPAGYYAAERWYLQEPTYSYLYNEHDLARGTRFMKEAIPSV